MSSRFIMIGMEYCTGKSLEHYMKSRNGRAIDESIIQFFAHHILTAIFNSWEKGFINIDIKPENILIDEFSLLKLTDLGFEKDTNGQPKLSSKTIDGTGKYWPPELEYGESQSEKSDVWSLGVLLLELAYGRDTYSDSEIRSMDSNKIKEELEAKRGYSNEMVSFLLKCFERESIDRATIEELLRHKWLRDVDINTVVPAIKSGIKNVQKDLKIILI